MRRFIALFIVLILCVPFIGARADIDLQSRSDIACQALLTGDYAQVVSMLDETTGAQLNADILSQTMVSLAAQYGALSAITGAEYLIDQNAAVYTLQFENGALYLSFGFDVAGKIAALTLTPAPDQTQAVERTLPEGVREIPVTLYPDSERITDGVILMPEKADADTPCVVFIHGSGPSDMDQTMGPNKMFRDIAYDLAAQGVGSLRFDKLTYSHPELFTGIVTVESEYLEPVKEALRVLRENVPSEKIYALGHSLGGMLTPWLADACGFTGGISLAGTPLPLWQMSYDQNLLVIETVPTEQRPALTAQVDAELEKALTIKTMPDEQAASETVFGMNGMYLKSIDVLDQCAIADACEKPFLFMKGEQDVQVNSAAFEAWKTGLSADGPYTCITYPELNHMFLPAAEGDSIANVQAAYSRPAFVPGYIAADIAAWIASIS